MQVYILCSFFCVKKLRLICKLIKSITVVVVRTHLHAYSQLLHFPQAPHHPLLTLPHHLSND